MATALLSLGMALDISALGIGASPAEAVVGRPLTPVSYAGVARRTTRRAAYTGAAVATTAAVGVASVAATAAMVSTLPAGCINRPYGGITYYHCGSVYYQPVYDGPNVVYLESSPPG